MWGDGFRGASELGRSGVRGGRSGPGGEDFQCRSYLPLAIRGVLLILPQTQAANTCSGSRGMPASPTTIHEVDFCAQVESAINVLISQNSSAFAPLFEARVEGFGTGAARRKRKDLRILDRSGKVCLCGEVKLPGTPEGRSAVSEDLVADAAAKADDAGVQYFFTWNVNEFALWDRSRWEGRFR